MMKFKSHFIEFSRHAIGSPLRQCSIRQINTKNITKTSDEKSSSSVVETMVDDLVSPIQLRGHIKEFIQSTKKKRVLPETLNESNGNRLTRVNLNNPVVIPNLKIVTPTIHFKKESDIRITRLSNGLRVASVDNQAKTSVVNVLFGVGPRYEVGKEERGLSILMNKMSFKPSRKFDQQALNNLEDKIFYESRCEFETISYTSSFYRDRLELAIDMMSDCILHPRFEQEEIDNTINELKFNMSEQELDPLGSGVFSDMIMEACFGRTSDNDDVGSLGNPTLYANEYATSELLKKFQAKYFRADNCVITGVGVNHEQFVQLVEKYFDFDKPTDVLELKSSNKFISGDKRLHFVDPPYEYMKQNMPALTAVTVSFEGVNTYDQDNIFAIFVLETLLGGGNSFSSGGPGKGLQSLIYTEYLGRFRLYSMLAQHTALRDVGVFSIQASAKHKHASQIVTAITKLCSNMTNQITDEHVARAKTQFKAQILQNLEENTQLAHSIGADILYFDKYHGTEYLCSNIDRVTTEDVHRIVTKLLTGVPPAITVVGDLNEIPSKEQFDNFFQSLAHSLTKPRGWWK
jgi:processing peptidase subunit alpha